MHRWQSLSETKPLLTTWLIWQQCLSLGSVPCIHGIQQKHASVSLDLPCVVLVSRASEPLNNFISTSMVPAKSFSIHFKVKLHKLICNRWLIGKKSVRTYKCLQGEGERRKERVYACRCPVTNAWHTSSGEAPGPQTSVWLSQRDTGGMGTRGW